MFFVRFVPNGQTMRYQFYCYLFPSRDTTVHCKCIITIQYLSACVYCIRMSECSNTTYEMHFVLKYHFEWKMCVWGITTMNSSYVGCIVLVEPLISYAMHFTFKYSYIQVYLYSEVLCFCSCGLVLVLFVCVFIMWRSSSTMERNFVYNVHTTNCV